MSAARVGVDVGGTFTDFAWVSANGFANAMKRPSTPDDPGRAVADGIAALLAAGDLRTPFELIHGTTVATNALLERRGATVGLITTRGFADVIEIGRQARDRLYTFAPVKAPPLVPPELRAEITERIDANGRPLTLPNDDEIDRALDRLIAAGMESLAVCLLFAHLNGDHERAVGRRARLRGVPFCLSCEIAPEPREFERTVTTVANAFVSPRMSEYLTGLERAVGAPSTCRVRVMQSDGGALTVGEAGRSAVRTALSGPAGGVVAAARLGRAIGRERLLTFDMGGASTDVATVTNGEMEVATNGAVAGLPLLVPMLDIHTVGAGGGSIVRLDAVGGLRVGPQSAGADPGPVAYGRGEHLTVTDANIFLGRIPIDRRLGGTVAVNGERVRTAFGALAERSGRDPNALALGAIDVVNASMARALRTASAARGLDPASFSLVSYGGAGGLHACALANELGVREVIVPAFPGAFSALGLLLADVRREFTLSIPAGLVLGADSAPLTRRFEMLEIEAEEWRSANVDDGRPFQAQRVANARYVGQSHDLRVPVRAGAVELNADCHAAHRQRFGHADGSAPVEIVALRLIAIAPTDMPFPSAALPNSPGSPAGAARILTARGFVDAPVFVRSDLCVGQRIGGPALVTQADATTLIAEDWSAVTDALGNLIVSRGGAAS